MPAEQWCVLVQGTVKAKLPPGIDMNVNVLTSGYWPSYPHLEAKLPDELTRYQTVFKVCLCYAAVLYCALLCRAVLCCTVLCCAVHLSLCCTMLCITWCAILCCALHGVPYYALLCCDRLGQCSCVGTSLYDTCQAAGLHFNCCKLTCSLIPDYAMQPT